jgi:hypothetical protein
MTTSLHEDVCKFMISGRIILRIGNVPDECCSENPNTFYVQGLFFPKIFTLMSDVEKYGRAIEATDDNVIRRSRFVCWIIQNM